ncbi:peptidylprolyl isomerase [Candidatus Pacearchaeota archaeon CG10_big_fil_rev_8_21_14_0_10_34_76]|nr:MAG: peptidylprolyl isomerase [Candidatus Pacearchaeota archaeon CG10_big_fil_rev_8_21_14_0_10_34_76]
MSIKKNDKIKVEYEGRLEDGTVFDSSEKHNGQLLEFTAGVGEVIKGFDDAVIGMEIDEEKEFTLKPEEAYGEANEELKQDIPKDIFKGQEPKPGMVIVLSSPDGKQFPVNILSVNEESITVDLNHPLAGKTLIFKIKIKEIQQSSE